MRGRNLTHLAALAAVLGAAACADDVHHADGTTRARLDARDAGSTSRDAGTDGSKPSTPVYVTSVVANGTGCKAGTWSAAIAPEGTFTVHFEGYELSLGSDTADRTLTHNCTLLVDVHAPDGTSFALSAIRFAGYAFLEAGVTANLSASYRFQGAAMSPSREGRLSFVGPFDQDYVFQDEVRTQDLVWSPCGVARQLVVSTQIQLVNGTPKRSGYVSLLEIPAGGELELVTRACGAGPRPPTLR